MSLVEYVQKVGAFYNAINRANSTARYAVTQLVESRGKVDLRLDATFGDVPVISAEDLDGIDSVFLEIDYTPGSQTPQFRFEERQVPGWGNGYFKAPSNQKQDEPVRAVIDVRPKERGGSDQHDTMRFESLYGGQIGYFKDYQTVREFHYMMDVIDHSDEWIQDDRRRGHQDIAERGIGSVMNTGFYDNGITFHMGISNSLDLKGRLDYIASALRSFFELKGYQTVREVDVGKINRSLIERLTAQKEDARKTARDLSDQLEQVNVLQLSKDDVGFLGDYFRSLGPFLTKYTELRRRFGEDLELDPVERFVEAFPTNGRGPVQDLASYTIGLQRAVKEGNHELALRKLRMVWGELIDLNRKVSPDYRGPETPDDLVITLFSESTLRALPDRSS